MEDGVQLIKMILKLEELRKLIIKIMLIYLNYFVSQGHINEVYLCELPSTEEYSNEEHKKVVIKIVEKMEKTFNIDVASLYINYLLVGEANLGPKVLGVFKGGIITEFFEVFI